MALQNITAKAYFSSARRIAPLEKGKSRRDDRFGRKERACRDRPLFTDGLEERIECNAMQFSVHTDFPDGRR